MCMEAGWRSAGAALENITQNALNQLRDCKRFGHASLSVGTESRCCSIFLTVWHITFDKMSNLKMAPSNYFCSRLCTSSSQAGIFKLMPEQVSSCEVPIVFVVTTFLSQLIAFFTAWTYPKTHQTWNLAHTYQKMLLIPTTRWSNNQGKCILPHNSRIIYHTLCHKPYVHVFPELCWVSWYRPCPFPPTVFFCKFAIYHKPTFSPICMKLCKQHLWILLTKSSWSNFDISNNTQVINFLQILLQTGSVAYLHISLSEWHETQATTTPWAPGVLWLITTRWHSINWTILYLHIGWSD